MLAATELDVPAGFARIGGEVDAESPADGRVSRVGLRPGRPGETRGAAELPVDLWGGGDDGGSNAAICFPPPVLRGVGVEGCIWFDPEEADPDGLVPDTECPPGCWGGGDGGVCRAVFWDAVVCGPGDLPELPDWLLAGPVFKLSALPLVDWPLL